jgi:hypothetical protein
MMQSNGFIAQNQENMICKLQRSPFMDLSKQPDHGTSGLMRIKFFGFEQNLDEPSVYKKYQNKVVTFLVLYVDDVLHIGNNVGTLSTGRIWLSNQFDMKDFREISYILGIKLSQDHINRMIDLSQTAYIDKILANFSMLNSKKLLLPFRHGVHLTKKQCPKTFQEEEQRRVVSYSSTIRSLIYAMLCTRPYIFYFFIFIFFAVGMVKKYQPNPGPPY